MRTGIRWLKAPGEAEPSLVTCKEAAVSGRGRG